MLSARAAYRLSLAAGLLIVTLAVIGRLLPSAPVCGGLQESYGPIIAFELVRSMSDLQAIFGSGPSECREAIVAQLDTINTIDNVIYIPIYGSFLIFFLLALRPYHRKLAVSGASVVALACIADYVENAALFKLSANPDVITGWLTTLMVSTEVKWIGLGLAGAIAGHLLTLRGGAWRLAFIPCSIGLLVSVATVVSAPFAGPYLSVAFLFGWIVFLAVDVRESFRK